MFDFHDWFFLIFVNNFWFFHWIFNAVPFLVVLLSFLEKISINLQLLEYKARIFFDKLMI